MIPASGTHDRTDRFAVLALMNRTLFVRWSLHAPLAAVGCSRPLQVVGLALFFGLVGCHRADIPPYSPSAQLPVMAFRTAAEHEQVMEDRSWPYVLEIRTDRGALVYYGSRHTQDPEDPQIPHMLERWEALQPTVAVTENRGGFYIGGFDRAVRSLGEFAVAIEKSQEAGIPVYSLEPTWEDEVAEVVSVYSPAEATLFYTLRVFLSERGNDRSPESTERLAQSLLRKRGSRAGLEGSLTTLAAMDSLWEANFDDLRDWRELPPQAIWPGTEDTRLQAMARHVNEVRDRHAARVILDLLRRGERVFAIAGGSHVVKQEPVLVAGLQDDDPWVNVSSLAGSP